MEIIQLNPLAAIKNKNKNVDIQKCDENEKLNIDEFNFTCPECNNINRLKLSGMIFKTIEFFCKNCGKKYKVKNNGFK